jgi:hypothetical protein
MPPTPMGLQRSAAHRLPNSEQCQLAPDLRILSGPKGPDEMELDGVLACGDTMYITSHKTFADAMT